jgi:hypothetical protein
MVVPKTLDPVEAVSCAVTIERDAPRAVLIPGSGQGDDTAGAATGAPNAQARRWRGIPCARRRRQSPILRLEGAGIIITSWDHSSATMTHQAWPRRAAG